MADAELRAAYTRLDEAISEVCRLEEHQGVLTEWLLITAHDRYGDDGGGITQVGMLVPEGGSRVAHHRLMGLCEFALTRLRKEVADDGEAL